MIIKDLLVASGGAAEGDAPDPAFEAYANALHAAIPRIGADSGRAILDRVSLMLYVQIKHAAIQADHPTVEVDWKSPAYHAINPSNPRQWIPVENALTFPATIEVMVPDSGGGLKPVTLNQHVSIKFE